MHERGQVDPRVIGLAEQQGHHDGVAMALSVQRPEHVGQQRSRKV
jgi:hypothetical protein